MWRSSARTTSTDRCLIVKTLTLLCFLLLLLTVTTAENPPSSADGKDCPADTPRKTTGICLNMIVKDEVAVLPRLINSVKNAIDYYVIVDTGSTDDTVALIQREMKQNRIPGRVEEEEWVNFATNRNQALQLALEHCPETTEWILIIDADEELVVLEPNFYEQLEHGVSYRISKHSGGMRYALPNLINSKVCQTWKWFGAVHEYLSINNPDLEPTHRFEDTTAVYIQVHAGEGARSLNVTDEEKYLRDAKLLKDDLLQDPNNSRSWYYLAQSYRDAGHTHQALQAFRKRVAVGGWIEETFWAQYQVGRMTRQLVGGTDPDAVLKEYLQAYELRPSRIEPLFDLAEYFRLRDDFAKAFLFAMTGVNMTVPNDSLFNMYPMYEWKIKDELCTSAYYVGRMEEGKWACSELIRLVEEEGLELPSGTVQRIRGNLKYYTSD